MLDPNTRCKGIKTAVKMMANVVERLEAGHSDWQVGCKCSSAEKALFVSKILEDTLKHLQMDKLKILVLDDNIVEVRLYPDNLVVSIEDAQSEEECDTESCSGQAEQEHHDTETPVVSSALDELSLSEK